MPRNKKKHISNRGNGKDPVSESFQQRDINATSMRCTKCNQPTKTNNLRFGNLCHRCKRPDKYKWREKQSNYKNHKQETVAYNNVVFDSSIYRSISNSNESQCNVPSEVWERRVYPTPPQQLNNFYIPQRNSDIPSTSQFYGEGHINFEGTSEATTSSSGYYSSNANAYMSQTSFDRGFKRRQESEGQYSKRLRPASPAIYPPIETNLFSETAYMSPTFDRGFKRLHESEDPSSKRYRPSSPPIFPPIETDPFSELSRNMWKYFFDNCQTDEVFKTKMALRSKLQRIIQSKFDADLFVFGSSMNGFGTATSDIDMCLMFHDQTTKMQRIQIVKNLRQIHKLFRSHNFLKDPQVIPAKVPILKFQHRISGFDIDININNPTGIRNSQLLRSYARIDERVRPLILAVKFWARFHDINDAKFNTLSSYALGLMVIHYLQYRCMPPVLPVLQMLQPDKYRLNSDVRTLKVDEDLPHFISHNKDTVGQLFAGFLRYYSKEYNFEMSRLSVRLGKVIPRVENALNDLNQLRHWIDIEEPFERSNVARSVANPSKFPYMTFVFENSCELVHQQKTISFS